MIRSVLVALWLPFAMAVPAIGAPISWDGDGAMKWSSWLATAKPIAESRPTQHWFERYSSCRTRPMYDLPPMLI